MNRLDALRSDRKTGASVWLQYAQKYAQRPKDLFVFFEGRSDVAFYMPELRRRWHGEVTPLVCNGKEAVIAVCERIQREYPGRTHVLFFIDKDLDDYLGLTAPADRRVFCTEVYSIENYLVSDAVLTYVWTDLFHLETDDPRLAAAKAAFQRGVVALHRLLRPLMAWVLWHRRNLRKPVLNELRIDSFIRVDADLLPRRRREFKRQRFEQVAKTDSEECCVSQVLSCSRALVGDPKRYVRGKFELWYFAEVLKQLLATHSKRDCETGSGEKRARCTVQISPENCIEILAGRGPCPQSVDTFLRVTLPGWAESLELFP